MKPLALFLAASLGAAMAFAAPATHKDWTSGEGPDDVHGFDSCWIATSVATGTHKAQLVLSAAKDGLSLPQVLVKIWDAPNGETRLRTPNTSKTFHDFLLWKASTKPEDASVYWYAPVGLPKLLETIAAANTLAVQGTTVQSKVSLKGSADAVSAWRKCMKKIDPVPEDFLKKLNTQATVNESAFGDVQQAIDGLERAFVVYRDGMAATKELSVARDGAKKLLSQEKDALATYNKALTAWQKTSDELAKQRAKEATLQATLADTKADLAAKQTELPIAEDDLKVKTATYTPVRAQMDPLFKEVKQREDALASNIRETKRLYQRVADIPGEISSLRRERSNLDSQISSLDSQIYSARRAYDDAESTASRYNADWEARNEFDRDSQASWARSRIQQYRQEAMNASNDANNARSRLATAQGALSGCRTNPQADCSSQQNNVNQYQNEVNAAESRRQSAESNQRSAEWDLDRIRNSIYSKHQDIKRRLQSEADDLERRWRSLQSQQDQARARRNQIDQEIPDLQAELSRAKARIPVLEQEKPVLEQALADAQKRRDALAAQIDYVRIEKEYRDAIARVDGLKKGIAADQKLIAQTEKELKALAPVIASLVKDEAAKMKTRDTAAAKLAPIQEALKPFRAVEATLTTKINDLAAEFEKLKSRFQQTTASWFAAEYF